MSTIVTYDLTKKANKLTFGTVVINRIDNPFDPIGSKVTKTDLHGLTLDKYLDGYCLGVELMVVVNGKHFTEDFSSYLVKPNDVITYTPILKGGGGGGGKQILAIVAMIALVVVSGGAAAGIMGATAGMFGAGAAGIYGGLSGALILAGLQASILIAGSLLINAVLGTGAAKITATTPEIESSTYSWNGIQTSRDINKPIPVLYGTHALGGTVINSRFYYKGSDDWIATQLALCHGEIQAVTSDNIKVNDADYSSFIKQGDTSNGFYQYRNGAFSQSIMTGYSDSFYNNGAVSHKLDYNVPWVFTSESTNIDFFRLHFEFPSGLYNMDTQGIKSESTVQVQVKYRKVGTTTWFNMYNYDPRGVLEYKYTYYITVHYLDEFGNLLDRVSEFRELWSSNPNLTVASAPTGAYNFTKTSTYRYSKNAAFTPNVNLTFTAKSSVALKKFFEPVDKYGNPIILADAQYEFSVTRITPQPADEEDPYKQNKCHVRFLEEIQTANINYGGIALLGIDLKATDQLSNSRPNFKVQCTRKPLKINNIYRDSTNPAWICMDILTNKHYGMGLNISEIDTIAFTRWAEFCDGGIANTFTLSKTIVSLTNNVDTIAGDLVIPMTDLPEDETLSLSKLVIGSSSTNATGETLTRNPTTGSYKSVDVDMEVNAIDKITLKYISNHATLADGYYYLLSFRYNLKVGSSISYELVFKDRVYTATPKLAFNGLFDTSSDVWTSMQDVAQVGRGQVILRGNKYSCIYDDVKVVKGMFNAANSKNVTVQYISNADIASEIEIQYSDANIEYEMNSISVQDADAMASGVVTNKTTKQIKGITTEAEALVMGRYLLASSKYLRRIITLDADIESITQTVGDLVAIQTDVTQYGIGGIVLQKLGDAVILDNLVTLQLGVEYTLKIKNVLTDDIKDYTFTPSHSAQADYTFNDSAGLTLGVLKFDDFALVINNEYNGFIETNTLLIAEGYEIQAEDRYSFGISGSDSILCTILDIDRDGDLTRRITAIEYNESILDFNYDNDMVQRLVPTGRPINSISGFKASDRLVKLENSQVVAMVSFAWDSKISSYYNIYLLEEDGYKNYLGNNIRENRFEYPNTVMVPEKPYTIYIEDTQDMSIISTLNYTITSFSAVPGNITSVNITPVGSNLDFTVNYNNKPLDFAYYNVYRNSTLISTQISDTFSIRHVIGTNSVNYSIEAVDMIKKKSAKLSQAFITTKPSIFSVDYLTEGENIKLSITPTKGSFDIDYYTISSLSGTFTVRELTALIKANYTGVRTFSITATDVLGNTSNVYSKDITISIPQPTNLIGSIEGKEAVISWGVPNSAIAIDYYEIVYDSVVIKSKSTSYRLPVFWGGSKTFEVATVNILGAKSAYVSTSITINTGLVNTLQTEVIDNNVLLRWNASNGSLPIENFMLYKGIDINNLVAIGEKKGTFTTIFESEAGTYTYWLGAIDSAGNLGTLKSATTLVSEPPDYILNVNWVSTFNGTFNNAKLDAIGIVLPINTSESIQQHFVNNGWTSPQAQVTSGNPLWIQPFLSSGYYEEDFDYGTTLASSLVTVNLDYTNLAGTPTITPTVSISSDGVNYTDYVGQFQVYGTGFRYVKVKIEVTGTNNGVVLHGLEVKLDSKIKNDSGTTYAVAPTITTSITGNGTIGTATFSTKSQAPYKAGEKIVIIGASPASWNGTWTVTGSTNTSVSFSNTTTTNATVQGTIDNAGTMVLFNKEFVDITAISVTPSGTTAKIAIYDFVDEPNPTSFKVLLYNTSGVRVDGAFSWSVRGY